ncbi:TetR family transcriptional regulator [Nocardia puris]|uniref:TetR/AcrR family transcriptional regulator n=1 Tax=Nocardia puris TaxID=208602 RepID=UPI0011BD76D6|nr:TetR family transcriptional regulator [Nocardia puris]MBF6214732.1 TetR family transcriptional regulator [Nocardia puris]MBF6368794.1 TetR family transcriptional regulator [Nocardia puris]MBF6462374.1 TetR family transcriptional regulator [Nocardia puris]
MTRLKAEQRRRLLVDAAFTVMARDGVAAASTRAICAEAGMPQSAFHYVFRSKEELLRELTAVVVNAQTAALDDLDVTATTLRGMVHAAFEHLLAATVTEPGRQAVLYELMLLDLRAEDDPGALGRWQYRLYTERATALLGALTRRFGVRWRVPVPALARMVATSIDGAVLAWLADRDTETAGESLRALAEAVIGLAEGSSDGRE